ncbi:hypothetical protein [Hyphomicrobium sp. NDB2Meth4]|uniref:hypothetical protein n=1 Tax=Hyphomicrobium sp. NDB2Meth4 TaxID=1892846 RepID=UPI000B1BBD48|nr:hypothetical protein [Hyphomicrobium sp. NDB2Meth4]
MMKQTNRFTYERERALGHGIRELASDLRLVEPADYINFVRTERFANIANLIASSAELFFKPGTISFGHSGDVDVGWDHPPTVALDMEFRHMCVNVYFRLVLEAQRAGVEITYVAFEGASDEPDENTRRLVEAIADARLMPVPAIDDAPLPADGQVATSLGQA